MIIGICGQMGSGKDTTADYLVDKYGYRKLMMAYPFKEFSKKVFNWSNDQIYGESTKRNQIDLHCLKESYWDKWHDQFQHTYSEFCDEVFPEDPDHARSTLCLWFEGMREQHHNHLTPRVVLQTLGTEWGQALDKCIWANHTINHAKKHPERKYVISDVRFIHEIYKVTENHGKLIRLDRSTDFDDTHVSEKEILTVPSEMFDAVISNNMDKYQLYNTLDIIIPALERTRACHTTGFPPTIS